MKKFCEICENIDKRVNGSYHIYIPCDATVFDLKNIQNYLLPSKIRSKSLCERCNKNFTTEYKPSKIIVIDSDNPDFRDITKHTGKNTHVALPKISISVITNEIVYADISFELRGIIEHRIQGKHFVVYVKRQNQSWELYDDLMTKPVRINKNRVVDVAAVLYRQKGIVLHFTYILS